MSITLKPEHERFIQAQVQAGKFSTAEEALDVALRLLAEWSEGYADWVGETRQKIDLAIAQIDRGEVLEGEVVIVQLQAKLNQAREAKECPDSSSL